MKKLLLFALAGAFVAQSVSAQEAEDKSKRPSPPATVKETIRGGVSVAIDYSQPAVKGRTIGKEIAPYGQVWRTGANEATTFTVSAPVTIEGKTLPAGTYDLFTIPTDGDWTVIFNSELTLPNGKPTWGAYTYHQDKDVLRVTVPSGKSESFMERMTFLIGKDGVVSLVWGDKKVNFHVAKG
ncbi:MAG TPA: DUF2911 domain-containing protein [Dinghuibacter sp.]|jgi:hypothetical protein|uniref:DUF2911 domain-containing protein n=1 Tax=Dinghuibacter sp. TaxID=2024697 RepID=UPI002C3B4937|nr:DUF2911 domain-containing protein [Dinghuibacter sp.]HTJ11535.1 DUF2911 domain-containing protein [Dinghuibacter sp.]